MRPVPRVNDPRDKVQWTRHVADEPSLGPWQTAPADREPQVPAGPSWHQRVDMRLWDTWSPATSLQVVYRPIPNCMWSGIGGIKSVTLSQHFFWCWLNTHWDTYFFCWVVSCGIGRSIICDRNFLIATIKINTAQASLDICVKLSVYIHDTESVDPALPQHAYMKRAFVLGSNRPWSATSARVFLISTTPCLERIKDIGRISSWAELLFDWMVLVMIADLVSLLVQKVVFDPSLVKSVPLARLYHHHDLCTINEGLTISIPCIVSP